MKGFVGGGGSGGDLVGRVSGNWGVRLRRGNDDEREGIDTYEGFWSRLSSTSWRVTILMCGLAVYQGRYSAVVVCLKSSLSLDAGEDAWGMRREFWRIVDVGLFIR